MAALSYTVFPQELEKEIFSKVKGHSSLAKLAPSEGIPMVGKDVFVFDFDSDIEVVGENAEKGAGDANIAPVSIKPVKVQYTMRTSNEFMYASEEYQLNILKTFAEGTAKKVAAGIDKMALLGINPKTGLASSVIGTNHFNAKVTNTVTYNAAQVDENVEDAITLVTGAEYVVNGIALSPAARGAMADLKDTNGQRLYPDFKFGGAPANLGGAVLDVNASLGTTMKAVVGDFNAFKWGVAKNIPIEVIEFGDPDGQGDLKRHNQIALRSEAWVGWGILDADAFAIVK